MNDVLKDVERPYHVVCILGGQETFAGGFMTAEEASLQADIRNQKAADMGIVSRYETREGSYLS